MVNFFMPQKNIRILQNDISLIRFANEFSFPDCPAPLPLRRTFSLLRDFCFKTIVCEYALWQINEDTADIDNICNEQNCDLRFISCKQYAECLKQYYGSKLDFKECYKIAFFKKKFFDERDIEQLIDEDLLAFCIVHRDRIFETHAPSSRLPYVIETVYVTESIINIPEKRMNIHTIGKLESNFRIRGKEFFIKGNYFSQQNSFTNCCAHAAIKMAIRGYHPQITAETINAEAGIDHEKRKGNEGLEPGDFIQVIKKLSGQEADYFEARSFKTPLQFLKLIYHAIESGFPVILLFTYPDDTEYPVKQGCHAATLIGHTFNKHTWWSYAWRGYFKDIDMEYLPSVIWCDNFVIQDDNLGPYYLLPLHSLKILDSTFTVPLFLRSIVQNTKYQLSKIKKMQWLYQPMYCIIPHPKKLRYIEDVLKVEPFALDRLTKYISYLGKQTPSNNFFLHYFLPNFKDESLILRTFALSKKEYLQNFAEHHQLTDIHKYIEALEHILPEFIWITEISIPELYWINRKKIGEIITDPNIFHESPVNAVKFLLLPGLLSFFDEKGNIQKFFIEENDCRYPLINPECKKCFS